jgi:WhiB family redox-sensing transcriptional regulator
MRPIGDWQSRAACRQLGAAADELFFADTQEGVREALAICQRCRVRPSCLEYAIRTRQEYGVWGGRTEQQLRRLIAAERQGRSARTGRSHNTTKTRCKRGHPFDAANTYYAPGGERRCRACMRSAFTAWTAGGGRRA